MRVEDHAIFPRAGDPQAAVSHARDVPLGDREAARPRGPARRASPLLGQGDLARRGERAHFACGDARGRHDGAQRLSRPRLQGAEMKLHYYPETDSLYIELRDAPSAETREIVSGLNVDFDAGGNVVGLD